MLDARRKSAAAFRKRHAGFMLFLSKEEMARFEKAMGKQRYGVSKAGVVRTLISDWCKSQGVK